MALPAAVGFVLNAISNLVAGVPVVLTRVSVGVWAAKSADELESGLIYLPKNDPARIAAERELIEKFMREVLPLTTEQSDFERPIEQIKRQLQSAAQVPSPIVLDLDGNGVQTVSLSNGVFFDHGADGFAERSGWVAPGDGLLVWDRNANNTIDSGRELFGSETLLPDGTRAVNGFEALRALDANADGVIDASDPVFAQLRVWVDASADGRSGEGELLTLQEAGVRSINDVWVQSTPTQSLPKTRCVSHMTAKRSQCRSRLCLRLSASAPHRNCTTCDSGPRRHRNASGDRKGFLPWQ